MSDGTYNVLFLCTGNSARSVLAECLLNRIGEGKFRAYSAGSQPKGKVHPMALELLGSLGYDTQNLRSKSWDEFGKAGAPDLDFVFTVCGNAADEVCPVWIGEPLSAHWGIEDPAAVTASEGSTAPSLQESLCPDGAAHSALHRLVDRLAGSADPARPAERHWQHSGRQG